MTDPAGTAMAPALTLTLRPASPTPQCPACPLAGGKRGRLFQPISAALIKLDPSLKHPSYPSRVETRERRLRRGTSRGSPSAGASTRLPGGKEPSRQQRPAPRHHQRSDGNCSSGPGAARPRKPTRTTIPGMPHGPPANRSALCSGGAARAEAPFKMADDSETAVRRPPARPSRPAAEENDHEHCSDCENEAEHGSNRG